jgi:hypothetical protein
LVLFALPHVISSAKAAALITTPQIHPSTFAPREFVRLPITLLSLVRSTTKLPAEDALS